MGMLCWGCDLDGFIDPGKNRMISVSAGKGCVAFVRENGKAFIHETRKRTEARRKGSKHLDVKQAVSSVSCEETHVTLLTEEGRVFQLKLREANSIPKCVTAVCDRLVTQIACGDHHSVALTHDGQVFTWGQNSCGQLGVDKQGLVTSPQHLSSLSEIPLVQVAAGGDHSFTVSISGAVFGWGRNNAGQLGLGDRTDRRVPTPVHSLNGKKVLAVACGSEHTAVLTKGGLVFTFGSGQYGQLGHNSYGNELRARMVAELWGSHVSQIACGRSHTLALTSLGRIYAFGCGECGQLGNGDRVNQKVPLAVHLPPEFARDKKIERIAAGYNQSFAFFTQPHESPSRSSILGPTKPLQTLEDAVVDQWLADCDTKRWKKIEKEISRIFSTASCLNGSFLEKSWDKHYQTSPVESGLDLSLARQTFEKVAKQRRPLIKIESVLEHKLLPSLSRKPASVEGLRVYLIIPEILRVLGKSERGLGLTVAFSTLIFRLHPDWLRMLEGLWLRLPDAFFRSFVKIYRLLSNQYLLQMRWDVCSHWESLEKTLCVLQKLCEVNSQRRRTLEDSNFHLSEITVFVQSLDFLDLRLYLLSGRTIEIERVFQKVVLYLSNLPNLTRFPCLFDMKAKTFMFRSERQRTLAALDALLNIQTNTLQVNRDNLLSDTFHELRKNFRHSAGPLQVKFLQEDGMDMGGVSQEFFTVLARELHLLEPKVLQVYEESSLLWFNPEMEDCDCGDIPLLLGTLYGMALNNLCLVDFHFPLVLFKKLLNMKPSLEDLKELSPLEARSLQNLLDEDEDLVEDLYLDFTVKGHGIVPHGGDLPVTKYNRNQYVDAYVEFVFDKSVTKLFRDFKNGFSRGCGNKMWKIFSPEELMCFLCGNVTYKWEELQQNARYEGYKPTDATIQNFWSVFTDLSEDQKKCFLAFMTGTHRLPIGGLSKIRIVIVKSMTVDTDCRYPEAQTCFNKLILPNYKTIDTLREKLVHAISFSEVFGAK